MNIVTAQLIPLAPILGADPISKDDFVKRAREFTKKKNLVNLLEMIEFNTAYKIGDEIILN